MGVDAPLVFDKRLVPSLVALYPITDILPELGMPRVRAVELV